MYVPPQLFELKYRQLMSKYNLPEPPIYGDSCFLRDICTDYDEGDPDYGVD